MLIDARTHPDDEPAEPGLRWLADDRHAIGWKGHLYLPGQAAGEPSVRGLAEALGRGEDLAEAASRLRGVFGLLVHDRARGGWQACVDDAGLYKLFRDRQGASTSFLELLRARGTGSGDLDPAAMVEFLAHGMIVGEGTPAVGVAKLGGGEILELPADGGTPRLRPKAGRPAPPWADAATAAAAAVEEHFADLARSLEGTARGAALSVDATGGFDSRLVLCLLAGRGLPFELATSGRPDTPDVEIAREIAGLLDRPFHVQGHDLGDLDAQLEATFRAGDGLTDLRRFHRDRQLALARLARGVAVIAHGGGGELYRDHAFVHDFPRYGSRRVDLGRYYDIRFTPARLPPAWLAPSARELLAGLKSATVTRLERARARTNNETFDRIYGFLRAPEHFGQHCANYVNMGLDAVVPLLDRGNVLAAVATPPWSRYFFLWHRRLITRHCPALAALPTADGFSASAEPSRMLGDVGAFAATQARRAAKKASQRLTGRARFHLAGAFVADAPEFMRGLRASAHFAGALERLKAAGVLAPELAGGEVLDLHVGRIITLGMLLGEIEGAAAPRQGGAGRVDAALPPPIEAAGG